MKDDAAAFGSWGILTSNVPVDGNPKQILEDFNNIALNDIRLSMSPVFFDQASTDLPPLTNKPIMFQIDPSNGPADPVIFYKRVWANMIGLQIYNSLDEDLKKSLQSKLAMWTWKSNGGEIYYGGVKILQLLVTKMNPSTCVGVSDLKEKLRHVKLSNYTDNVHEMLEYMQDKYTKILQAGGSHEDYLMDI